MKESRKKRVLKWGMRILLTAVMAVGMLPMWGGVKAAETITVDVADNTLADGYYKIDGGDTITAGTADDYHIHFDGSTNTLTLNNAVINTEKQVGIRFNYSTNDAAATVTLIGENQITSKLYTINAIKTGSLPSTSADVEVSLTINGSGSLKASAQWGIQATNLIVDGSTMDITTGGHSALNISRDLTVRNAKITTEDSGDGGDFCVTRSLHIINSTIDISDIQVEYPAIFVMNDYCPEELLIKPALVVKESALKIGGQADSSLGFSLYVARGGAEISDSVLEAVNRRMGIAVADGELKIIGSTAISTGDKLAVRALKSAKIGEGVEITGAWADGKPLINDGLICLPESVTEEQITDTLRYYGGGTIKAGDSRIYHSVRFDLQDGTPLDEIEPQWILDGGVAKEPSNPPEKDGYDFTGWTEDGSNIWDFTNGHVTKSMRFLAHWTQNPESNQPGNNQPGNYQPGNSWPGNYQPGNNGSEQTRPDTGKPFIKGENEKEGWSVIREETENTKDGGTVAVDMNGAAIVPGDVLNDIKGRDITIKFDMGNGIIWSVNGQSITADKVGDIDFSVKTGINTIPADIIGSVTGRESYLFQISLAHEGEFGCTAVLSLDLGKENAGFTARLYYYNRNFGKLEPASAAEIAEDGTAELRFTHASDYVIVVDRVRMHSTQSGGGQQAVGMGAAASPDTGDKDGISFWLFTAAAAATVILAEAYFIYRRRKNKL